MRTIEMLTGAKDVLLKYPLQLIAPLVVLNVLTAGGGSTTSGNYFHPWWLVPVFLAIAIVAIAIAIVVFIIQVAVWLVTFEAARKAVNADETPSLREAWESVRYHLVDGRFGPSISRAWERTEGSRVELLVALVALVIVQAIAGYVLGFIPVIGGALSAAVSGAFGAAWAATLAVVVARPRA